MFNRHNRYYVNFKLLLLHRFLNISIMLLNVFVSRSNLYDYIEIDTDKLDHVCSRFVLGVFPSLFIDELIQDLIDKN